MLKKSLLMTIGMIVFIIGVILFPVPLPLGLPTMLIGLAIMFKASDRVKRKVIRWSDKTPITKKLRHRIRAYRRRKKSSPSS